MSTKKLAGGADELVSITGRVVKLTPAKPDGWRAVTLDVVDSSKSRPPNGLRQFKAAGKGMDRAVLRDVLVLGGTWENSKWGLTLKVTSASHVVGDTDHDLAVFLSKLNGVGGMYGAWDLIRAAGGREACMRLLESDVEWTRDLTVVRTAYRESKGLADARAFLLKLLPAPSQSRAVGDALEKWGVRVEGVLREDPWELMGMGVDWKTCDKIARELGVTDEGVRAAAAIRLSVDDARDDGATWMKWPPLKGVVVGLTPEVRVAGEERLASHDGPYQIEVSDGRCAIVELRADERMIAQTLMRLLSSSPAVSVPSTWSCDSRLDDVQRGAVDLALRHGATALAGYAGCGKSTTVSSVVTAMSAAGVSIVQVAPTGKAAQRLKEATGREASTIHRLLAGLEEGAIGGLVVVDESSMVDVTLMAKLCSVLGSARLLLVGDPGQLPSIGPGALLRDVIESSRVPVTELKRVYRNAAESSIPWRAQSIRLGEMPDLSPSHDFVWLEVVGSDAVAEWVLKVVLEILPLASESRRAFSPYEVQVIAPQKAGVCGVESLNRELQMALNPVDDAARVWIGGGYMAAVGDRVIHRENNYKLITSRGLGVFNGELGLVRAVEMGGLLADELAEARVPMGGVKLSGGRTDRVALVELGTGGVAAYTKQELSQLQLAYALTVHSMQGSQAAAVVQAVDAGHSFQFRSLLYTGLTRASEFACMIGQERTLARAVGDVRGSDRLTGLRDDLESES